MERVSGMEEEPELRHVEKDVLIPKIMREKARELCIEKVQDLEPPAPNIQIWSTKDGHEGQEMASFRVHRSLRVFKALQMYSAGHKGILKGWGYEKPVVIKWCHIFMWRDLIFSAFTKCCQDSGFLMVVKCREENAALKECLTAHYTNPAFYEECKTEYLKQREEFRTTGIRPGQKEQRIPTSM